MAIEPPFNRDVADEIRARLDRDPTISSPTQDTAELLAFRDDVCAGDVVASPDAQTAELLFGEIVGGYEYRYPCRAADFEHVRQVRWYGRFDRQLLPADLEAETRWRRTIRRLKHQVEWRTVAEGPGRGGPRRHRPRPLRCRGRRPFSPRAERPSDSTMPVLRTGEGRSQFIDGDDQCVDCR